MCENDPLEFYIPMSDNRERNIAIIAEAARRLGIPEVDNG